MENINPPSELRMFMYVTALAVVDFCTPGHNFNYADYILIIDDNYQTLIMGS